jgi:phosphatidylserine/phosphatidylglycerophosphate/cardiolipin synthase-like enzyme
VYLILPVHPEGALNVLNLMHQVHLTMQSLVFGEQSLVKRIQRHMAMKDMMDRGASKEEAGKIIERLDTNKKPVYAQQDWSKYLTLLNLRTWDTLGNRVVTEQIYVHSKLLIADDRVAILGSANINDRSQCGTRDSELAVIVRDSESTDAKLDGKHNQKVGKTINKLRKDLWKKHFGMSQAKQNGPVAHFTVSDEILDQPAAEKTWKAIQTQAASNSKAYEYSFNFIPRNFNESQVIESSTAQQYQDGFPSPIWPTWTYRSTLHLNLGGQISEPLPHEQGFWESKTLAGVKKYPAPIGVRGFITALPIYWTKAENNESGLNLTIIAHNQDKKNDVHIASLSEASHRNEHSS